MENKVPQKLRSIKKAYELIRLSDPETSITLHTLRLWCKEGKIKCLYVGNKTLVLIDSLMDYLSNGIEGETK